MWIGDFGNILQVLPVAELGLDFEEKSLTGSSEIKTDNFPRRTTTDRRSGGDTVRRQQLESTLIPDVTAPEECAGGVPGLRRAAIVCRCLCQSVNQ
jgi:hypothetical protein